MTLRWQLKLEGLSDCQRGGKERAVIYYRHAKCQRSLNENGGATVIMATLGDGNRS